MGGWRVCGVVMVHSLGMAVHCSCDILCSFLVDFTEMVLILYYSTIFLLVFVQGILGHPRDVNKDWGLFL